MKTPMAALLLAALMAAPALAQGNTEARDLLNAALEASQKAGGYSATGKIDREDPLQGMGMQLGGMMGDGIDGAFTATVAANGVMTVKVENEHGIYECFRKGAKAVQRQTWTGKQVQAGSFSSEAGALLSLSGFQRQLDKAKELKKGDSKKIGDVECLSVRGLFPAAMVEEPAVADGPITFKFQELRKVEATFWFGKDDRLVRQIEMKLTKGFPRSIRIGPGGNEGD